MRFGDCYSIMMEPTSQTKSKNLVNFAEKLPTSRIRSRMDLNKTSNKSTPQYQRSYHMLMSKIATTK